jgi:hypothetical protein
VTIDIIIIIIIIIIAAAAEVIPVIIGATGTISKSLTKYPSNIPGKHKIKGLQESSHTGHCRQSAGRANVKVQNIFYG